MNPLVTIIVTSYNQREYIAQAIESAVNQTYDNVEIIIVDNGSTDGSQTIIRQYEHIPNVRLVLHSKNIHITTKLNQCVALAHGEYISILHGDDFYFPNKIERQVVTMASLPKDYGVVYSAAYKLYMPNGHQAIMYGIRESGDILRSLLSFRTGFVELVTALIKKECLDAYKFHEDLFVEGEAIFWRIALRYKFAYTGDPLVVTRDHERNLGKNSNCNMSITMAALDRLLLLHEFPKELTRNVINLKSRLLRDYGWQSIRVDGNGPVARERLMRAVAISWKQVAHPRTVLGFLMSWIPLPLLRKMNALRMQMVSVRRAM